MSAIAKIKETYKQLKPVQKRIADYFLEVDSEGIHATIDEIAETIGTSVASISRFCKKLGFDSFQRFKITLSQDLKYEPDVVLPIFKMNDNEDLSIRKVFSEAITNLQNTELAVDFESIKKVVEGLRKSAVIYFFGHGGSGGVGYLGEVLFSHIGYKAQSLIDSYAMTVCAAHMKKNDALIGISHTGTTRSVVDSVRTAKQNGALTVAITNYKDSPLAAIADYTLLTACYEGRIHVAQSNSIVAQVTLLNTLYLLAAAKSNEEVILKVNEIERSVNTHLRTKHNK